MQSAKTCLPFARVPSILAALPMRLTCVAQPFRAFIVVCVLALCLPSTLAVRAQSAGQANRVLDTRSIGDSSSLRLADHLPAWATPSADLGTVPDAKPILLTIGIARDPRVQAAFTQLLADQQNPSSPRFHQWLTPEQIGAQFGSTQHDLDAVTNWLTSQGFEVQSVSPSRVAIRISAPAAVTAHALHTQLHYFLTNGRKLQAPTAEPAIPAVLAPVVAYIAGLADVPYQTNSHTRKVPVPGLTAQSGSFSPAGSAVPNYSASDGSHYIFPDDFNIIYDIQPQLSAGITGSGQAIAILGASRLDPADLTTWEQLSNLPSFQPNYTVPPGLSDPGPPTNNSDMDEPTLDFERAHGTAPGAPIDLIIAQNSLQFSTIDTMLMYEINTLRDPILSLSFGVCENDVAPSYIQNEDSIDAQAAAEGISVFVSSGDSGVAGCAIHSSAPTDAGAFPSINALCSSTYVTCVGGTEFVDTNLPRPYWSSTNGPGHGSAVGYIPEGAFNDPVDFKGFPQIFAGGGGPSMVVSKPFWQNGPGVPNDHARDTPDVSFSSSDHDGYFSCLAYVGASCLNGQSGVLFSGTSAAAPSMAGIAALLDQKLASRQGNLNPLLYRTASGVPADFHDATPGTIGNVGCSVNSPSICNNSTPGYNGTSGSVAGFDLTSGYDLATGLGSLDVNQLLLSAALPATAVALTSAPSTITISQTVVFTAHVSSGGGSAPSGTVQFLSNGQPLGAPVTLVAGVATTPALSFPLTASYTIDATYLGDSAHATSTAPSLTFVVTNPTGTASKTTLTLNATSASTAQGVTFTAAITGSKGTATGSVQFFVDGIHQGTAVAVAGGSAVLPGILLQAGTHTITASYSGDGNYLSSSSNSTSINVTALSSSTGIQISPTSITSTGTVTISSLVSPAAGLSSVPVPTGYVSLFLNNGYVGTLGLIAGSASGTLSGSTKPLAVGTLSFYTVYSGDNVYNGSTSSTAILVVTSASSGSGSGVVTLSAATPSLSVSAGASTSDLITLHSTTFSGNQAFTCSVAFNGSGSVSNVPTCNFSVSSSQVVSNGTATTNLSVSTSSAHSAPASGSSHNGFLPLGTFGGITFAALLLGILPRRSHRRFRVVRLLSSLVFLAGSFSLLSGCGSGRTSSSTSGGSTATTSGSYSIVISANSAAGQSTNVGATLTIPLTVH